MNKNFWDKVNRLEELAGKATPEFWYQGIIDNHSIFTKNELADDTVQIATCNEYNRNVAHDAEYIAAANPAMIQEMIAEMRRLEKEADWLSMSLAKRGNTEIFCCPENEPYKPIMECVAEHGSCANCWREAARNAIKVKE